jgi:trehalose/maltose hydrolase-like predicted phosphorylase
LEATGDSANVYQIGKQPDVLMLLYFFKLEGLLQLLAEMGYPLEPAVLHLTARYYLDRISHESSLSRIVCAGVLAAIDAQASWEFFEQSLCIDFDPANSMLAEEGLHLGAMAGSFDVLQRHYLGFFVGKDAIQLAPRPPDTLGPITLRLSYRGQRLALIWNGLAVTLVADWGNTKPIPVDAGGTRYLIEPGAGLTIPRSQELPA